MTSLKLVALRFKICQADPFDANLGLWSLDKLRYIKWLSIKVSILNSQLKYWNKAQSYVSHA